MAIAIKALGWLPLAEPLGYSSGKSIACAGNL